MGVCTIYRQPKLTVGASLLAKKSAHSTSTSPDTPPSRASPLPQGSPGPPKELWELACQR
ncbi:hypothetical protein DOZ80_19915 [Pseudomonas fluorescens]|uniref:Uncharacterized protein n=1 Tax=Pseudomonas fluorescens TaxID=294 RepID=A0A327MWH9_PSEFL|nr:hypothetical protein DOZ80_19915 [Pseudomonas fluorescens]